MMIAMSFKVAGFKLSKKNNNNNNNKPNITAGVFYIHLIKISDNIFNENLDLTLKNLKIR